jgi:glycosyltransferase involved in cell wall biosynthesis
LVSVVIPTFNSARYLPLTLQSILAQESISFEIIVVDDGSTDDTQDIVAALGGDSRLRYVKQPASGGPSGPRNAGIRLARGAFVALCDSDDIMAAGKLREAVAFLKASPSLGLVFTDMVLFEDDGGDVPGTFLSKCAGFQLLPKKQIAEKWYLLDREAAFEALLSDNFVGISGIVAPRHVLLEVGGFDETLSPAADWDLALRVTRAHQVGYLDMIGHRYRLRNSGLTGQGVAFMARDQLRVLGKQIEAGLTSRARARAELFLANSFFELGYNYQQRSEFGLAQKHYWSSLGAGCRGERSVA